MSDDSEITFKRNCLIAYALNNASNKLPMKAAEIYEFLGNKLKSAQIFKLAAQALKENYGIIFEEVPEVSGKKYFCYAENSTKSMLELDDEQKRKTTLLFIILSYIFMSDGSVYEAQLESFLKGLRILYDEEHTYFGSNVKKLISETFIKQLYLKRVKSESELDTDIRYLLEWGPRAHKEFNKMQVLETAAKLMKKNMKFFHTQFKAAQEAAGDG